jgi:hypothetical protein
MLTAWVTTIVLCTAGVCDVVEVTRHESRLACLQAAADARADLPPVLPGQVRVRDCARADIGPLLPVARRPGGAS